VNITAFSYCRTAQPKQYESVKVDVAAVPSDGQSTTDAFGELMAFVDMKVDEQCRLIQSGATTNSKPAPKKKAASNSPPLKSTKDTMAPTPTNGVMDAKADPTPAVAKSTATAGATPANTASNTNAGVANEPTKKAAKKKAAKAPDHVKQLTYTLESETLEELLQRFNDLREMAGAFNGEWEATVGHAAGAYRKLNTVTADPKVQSHLIAAFQAERTAIEEQKRDAANAELAA